MAGSNYPARRRLYSKVGLFSTDFQPWFYLRGKDQKLTAVWGAQCRVGLGFQHWCYFVERTYLFSSRRY